MQHQLREREQDLERKLRIKLLEKDDVHSQTAKARDRSPFTWISKGIDISECAKTMSETQTPTQPKTILMSARVEDKDVLNKVGLRTNFGHSRYSSLSKLKLNSFEGNPLE